MSERPSQSQPSSSPPIRRLRLSGVLRSHESDESLWQSLLLRLLFALIYGVKLNFFVEVRSLHFTGAPIRTGEDCCKSLASICGLWGHSLSLAVEPELDFSVSAATGWISHLDKTLQRKTNGPTSRHCLFNKRDEVADNLPRPASKTLINSEGACNNEQRTWLSVHCLAQSFPHISGQSYQRKIQDTIQEHWKTAVGIFVPPWQDTVRSCAIKDLEWIQKSLQVLILSVLLKQLSFIYISTKTKVFTF